MRTLHLDVWSDIACPWCWVGKRRLESAAARLPEDVQVHLTWRSFELDPTAPAVQPEAGSYAERLARKYRSSLPEAEGMIERMTAVGASEGVAMRFDRARPGNTFDAHRLLHLALERGRQGELEERLFRAYLSEGEAIGDRATLARLAPEAGLDAAEVRRVLDGEAYAPQVRADEAAAQRLGIHAVPFFLVASRYGVSGAQPADVLADVLRRAVDEAPRVVEQGEACGPDGC